MNSLLAIIGLAIAMILRLYYLMIALIILTVAAIFGGGAAMALWDVLIGG